MAALSPTAPAESVGQFLSFSSHNDDQQPTIVLLHGGFTCQLEFELVIPHLSNFHLLVPDLPLHSASRHILPGTTESSALHIARLIRTQAHGGKAHVVGVSMGGYIGQCLALDQPDIVLSLFVTGAAPLVGKRLFLGQWTRFTYYSTKFMFNCLPDWIYRYQTESMGLTISDELMQEMKDNTTWELMQDMFPWIVSFTLDHVRQLRVRVLSIAGAQGDDVDMIKKVAETLRSRRTEQGQSWPDDGSGAVVIQRATHGWDMQLPELFAKGVSAWAQQEELPDDFERL